MICQSVMSLMRRSLRSQRIAAWGVLAMIVGLVTASLGSVASAEPAAQAGPTATPTASSCVTPPQGVVILIQGPNPGDVLSPGTNVVVQGIAYDSTSPSGPGIDRVSVYLGDRDAGGTFWGNATLGLANPQAGSGPLSTAGFSLRSPTIPTGSGGRDIFVYAHSSVTNREGIASVPVFLGAQPTPVRGQVPTAVLPPAPVCTPVPTATAVPTSTPTAIAVAPPVAPVVLAATATPLPTIAVPTLPPVVPAVPAAPAVVAPPPAAPAAAAPPAAVAPATATTAPRGGGIPVGLGALLVVIGGLVVGGGFVARRREGRGPAPRP
jgi:hypothetical protein